MKPTLILVLFTALTAAAPQGIIETLWKRTHYGSQPQGQSNRCGGNSSKKCGRKEVCVGEKEFKDGMGVCIKNPKSCGNFQGDTCPTGGKYSCLNDPRIKCPPNVQDCGGGVCVEGQWVAKFGLKSTDKGPKRCGGPSGKKCTAKGENCLGADLLKDGMGVCVLKPTYCGGFTSIKCPTTGGKFYCVHNPDINCPKGVADCGGSGCLPGDIADKIGLKKTKPNTATRVKPSRTTTSEEASTTEEAPTTPTEDTSTTEEPSTTPTEDTSNTEEPSTTPTEDTSNTEEPSATATEPPPSEASDEPKRCGGSSDDKCPEGQDCLGAKILKDGQGICVTKPAYCGGAFDINCPAGYFYCVNNPDRNARCPKDVEDCGGSGCLPGDLADKIGVLDGNSPSPTRCTDSKTSDKSCGEKLLCVGQSFFGDGMGICIRGPGISCGGPDKIQCPQKNKGRPDYYCALNPGSKMGTCIYSGVAENIGFTPPEEQTNTDEETTSTPEETGDEDKTPEGGDEVSSDEPKRCGGSSDTKCDEGEDCLGAELLTDGMGICIKKPSYCGGGFNLECPTTGTFYCVDNPDANARCSELVADCEGSGCLPAGIADIIGIKSKSSNSTGTVKPSAIPEPETEGGY
ncbi:hypothetical protein ABW20_dc0102140 [Dactylellina cionopaga]|nr:hypothetical protein ABW20_dc0102140 [Dactylellina cionopaga]